MVKTGILNIPLKFTSILGGVFFFSGFASLIYQVVWQRLLTLHYGVGAVSITLIVSVYMLGLGFGALLGGYLAERVKDKIFLFFLVEMLIGIFGLFSLPFLKFLGQVSSGYSYLVSLLFMFLFLGLPTLLMGITLPLLVKIFNNIVHHFIYSVSYLYFINTLGAAIGAVVASYFIISFFGLDTGIYIAAGISFILAAFILSLRGYSESPHDRSERIEPEEDRSRQLGKVVYILVFVTGFIAIGYEIVWIRVVSVLVKASPYVFSSVLSVYLFGIAFGSLWMKRYIQRRKIINKRNLFFSLQACIGIYTAMIFIVYYYTTKHTPLEVLTRTSFSSALHPLFVIPSLQSIQTFLKDLYLLVDVFFWPLLFTFVPTLLMGASFPLISSLALVQPNKEGKTVGTVYFFNIIGNVFGGILTGFLLLPLIGTSFTLIFFSSIGILFGIFIYKEKEMTSIKIQRVVVVSLLIFLIILFFPKWGKLYKTMHTTPTNEADILLEEGLDSVVVTYKYQEHIWNYINGLHHGGRPVYHYYTKIIEAVSYAHEVENILIIGYGTGSFAEAVLKIEDLRKMEVVEISSTLIKNLLKMSFFRKMFKDDRVDLIIDDGRRYLLRTQKKFNLILMDPLRTTTSYSNNIYSIQFLDLVRQHLSKGGILLMFLGEKQILPKTVQTAFPFVRMYRIHGLDNYFCLASDLPFQKNLDREIQLFKKFTDEFQEGIKKYYAEYIGDQETIKKMAEYLPINKDWKPVCEYYFGLKVKEKLFWKQEH